MRAGARWTAEPCRNCGDGSAGRYCPACGQRKGEVRVSLRRMLADVLEDQLSINATLPRTLIAILFRPGRLTAEYLDGRIVSWIPPFRLYLAASVLFFLALSIRGRAEDFRVGMAVEGDTAGAPAAAEGVERALRLAIDSVRAAGGRQEIAAADSMGRAVGDALPEAGPGTFFGITMRPPQPGDSLHWTDRLVVNTGLPQLDAVVVARVRQLGGLPVDEAARRIGSATLDRIPAAMFVLLPVFAALLKLLYIRHRRFYVEHFVFALHYHAFAFLAFTLMLALQATPLRGVLALWMGVYLWLSLKRVYGQKPLWTTLKWATLSWAYLFVLLVGLLVTAVAAVLLL